MSIQTQIDRISGNISSALTAIAGKGVTVPDGSTSDALAELIASIEAGDRLPEGIAAITTGTYVPAGNVNNDSIEHGLSVTPNFLIMRGVGTDPGRFIVKKYVSYGKEYLASYSYKSSATYACGEDTADSSMFGDTSITIAAPKVSGMPNFCAFGAGVKYSWIAGVWK